VQSFDGTWVRQDTVYDARGRIAQVSLPYKAGETAYFTSYQYDIRDRVTRADCPDGSHTAVTFSPQGDGDVRVTTTEVNDAAGTYIEDQQKWSEYNVLGELVATTDDSAPGGKNVLTEYTYYATELPKTVTVNPGANEIETTFDYDNAGNRTSITGPDIGTVTSGYTALGELKSQTDNAGNTITFDYDLLGRIKTKSDPDGNASWTYDPANAIGSIATRSYGADFSEAFAYDGRGLIDTGYKVGRYKVTKLDRHTSKQ